MAVPPVARWYKGNTHTHTTNSDGDARPGERYTIEFIGPGGQVVQAEDGLQARYRLGADQPYVRARVTSSGGAHAWLQPHFGAPRRAGA